MKKQIFIVLIAILTTGFSSQLFAQEVMEGQRGKSKSNLSNNKSSEESTAVCIGKVRCADGTCSITFEQEIVSPRDAASGLPTGKRMHKPFTITKELDASSSVAVRESPTKASNGKVSVQDLSIMVTFKGRSIKLPVVNDEFTMPSDGTDNDCDLICSWSWGESHSGSSGISKKYEATFNLSVENGEYMASKHNKTGHVTLNK
jgi:hypothetical protein